MLMIRPPRALSIGRVTAFVIQKAPNRFVSRTSRHASGLIRMIRSSRVMPALLTRMSIFPNASRAAFTTFSAAVDVRDIALDGERPAPMAWISRAVSRAAASLPL